MSFGQTIKKLRRNADMTQEQLAEMLSISPQAVSRWETDAAMPDISILPAICNIFNISSDHLLGIDTERKEEKITAVSDNAHSYSTRGYYGEARKILEDGLRKFPNSYILMRDLMFVSYWQATRGNDHTKEECDNFKNQAIELGEKILESCTVDHIRHSAIQILCFAYKEIGKKDKAKELAKTMPHMPVSREMLMSRVTEGTARYEARQLEIYDLVQFLGNWLGGGLNTKLDSGEWAYTEEEIVAIRDKRIAFYDLIFENGDLGFYHSGVSGAHEAQAKYYAKSQNAEKVLHHLKLAAEHAINFLTAFNEHATHTSLLFKGYSFGDFSTWNTSNDALELLEKMKNSSYDFLRESEEFKNIEEYLTPYAEKWQVET